jgi:outer membrane protein assembly factor BamB
MVATDTTVFVSEADFTLAALSAVDGTLLWHSAVKTDLYAPPSIVNGLLYVLGDIGAPQELAAVHVGDGSVLWQVALPPSEDRPPVVRDGVVYLYYGTRDSLGACCIHHIAAYNAMTGAQLWLKSAPDVAGLI